MIVLYRRFKMNKLKIFFMIILFTSFTLSIFGETDVLQAATYDAYLDGQSYNSFGWGLASYGASVLLSPLLGGGITIICAYTVGEAQISATRSAEINEEYPDSRSAAIYTAKYKEELTKIQHKKNGAAAWGGTGLGFLTLLVIILIASS